jgi:hypothetical protein
VLSTLATEVTATSESATFTVRLTMASALQEADEVTPAPA